jgi:hypothetical protein
VGAAGSSAFFVAVVARLHLLFRRWLWYLFSCLYSFLQTGHSCETIAVLRLNTPVGMLFDSLEVIPFFHIHIVISLTNETHFYPHGIWKAN